MNRANPLYFGRDSLEKIILEVEWEKAGDPISAVSQKILCRAMGALVCSERKYTVLRITGWKVAGSSSIYI